MSLKKKTSRSIAIALVGVSMITPLFNTVSAMESNKENNTTINLNTNEENLNEKLKEEGYKQIKLSDIPKDVTPVTVNSIEDLDNEINEFEEQILEMNKPVSYNLSEEGLKKSRSYVTYRNFEQKKKISASNHWIFGTLKIGYFSGASHIASVHNLKQDWTGLSMGVKYENHPAKRITYTLINNKKTARITAPWKANHYIVADGIGHISSRYGSTTFNVGY